jgi:hypothetical protein
MKLDDFVLLVQGKIFPETYLYISEYMKLGFKIHLSTYEEVDYGVDQITINDISEAQKLLSDRTGTTASGKFQIYSTFKGLLNTNSKYVIKIRTDEFYTLDKIIKAFLNNQDKIICHNLFFRPAKPQWGFYHISDKLLVGKTQNLLSMFSVAYDIVSNKRKITYLPRCVEDLLGFSFILSKTDFNEEICFKHSDKLMNYFYDFVDFTELAPFKMKFNSMNSDVYTENTIDKDYHRPWIDVTKELADILWKNK